MIHTRRGFLQGASGLLSLSALGGKLAAQESRGTIPLTDETHFHLFLQIRGAWDVCLACDPKDRDLAMTDGTKQFDQPYAYSEVKEFANGIRLAPPAALLGRYADRLAIINGIDMEADNGHISDFVMTGSRSPRSSNLPYIQSVLARRQAYVRSTSIPHLFSAYDG